MDFHFFLVNKFLKNCISLTTPSKHEVQDTMYLGNNFSKLLSLKMIAIIWPYLVNVEISMINTKVGWYGNHIISFTALQRKSMRCVKWLMLIFQSTTWRLVGMEFTLLASNNPTQKLVAMDYSMNNYKVGLHWMMVSYAYTAAWISIAKFI